ncbi:SH3 domain-containing protein [Maribacter flavus]|uniref:SH3 domain-containing protein n=1 Tax=Maribacter flavus TaxID=1658664 RepID=UPI00137629CF|nr:SH3 domain-containing protein [Maribacter flavus]
MKNLIILATIFQINLCYTQNCVGSYPIYYTEDAIKIFQNMDSESAVLKVVPKGEAVKVLSSFFGSTTGFWKICWNGLTGYSFKNRLTLNKTSDNDSFSKNTPLADQELKFNPFLGQTSTAVNFRTGPSSSYSKITTLAPGSTLYVYSNETIDGYYKAIDIMSNEIGWVHNKYVIYAEAIEVNETGMFQSTGYSSNYNSEVNVENKSSYTIKLIVDSETFILSPNTTKMLNINPGRKYYIASAPGVIPASGYQTFESNNGYEWSFWVSTSRH